MKYFISLLQMSYKKQLSEVTLLSLKTNSLILIYIYILIRVLLMIKTRNESHRGNGALRNSPSVFVEGNITSDIGDVQYTKIVFGTPRESLESQ